MKKTQAIQHSHFAEILNAEMQQLDITIRELSKQLRISCEHARRLQAGEVLPSRLLLEKSAKVVGIPVEQLQLAVERDKILKKYGRHLLDKTRATPERFTLFRPLLESLAPDQVVTAYAKVLGLLHPVKAKRLQTSNASSRERTVKKSLPD
jgi:transcriptional regulator with XRE-family HTH domain